MLYILIKKKRGIFEHDTQIRPKPRVMVVRKEDILQCKWHGLLQLSVIQEDKALAASLVIEKQAAISFPSTSYFFSISLMSSKMWPQADRVSLLMQLCYCVY